MSTSLQVRNISKAFGPTRVLEDVSLDVAPGEFVSLVGSSGCGKSTLLRIIAGLEIQDGGHVAIGDANVESLSPRARNIALVFQSYALYPHMSAFDNIALPLTVGRLSLAERLPLIKHLSPRRPRVAREIATEVNAVEGGMQLIDWDQSRQQFGAGKIGIFFTTPGHLTQVSGLIGDKFKWGTSTFPIADEQAGTIPTGGNAIVMFTQDAAKQKAAWEFVKFMTGPVAQKSIVEMTGYLTTNLRAAGPEFLGPFYAKNPNYKTPLLQIDRAGPWGAYPGGNTVRIWRAQRDIIGKVMRGEITPDAGHAESVKTTRQMMKSK
jgi:ABC-type sugar transport system ATPase subunit